MKETKSERPQYWAVNRTFLGSMFEKVFKEGGTLDFYEISLNELKEISQENPLNIRFIGNKAPYKKVLDDYGIEYNQISDDIVLSPKRKDILFIITSHTTLRDDQREFPDYAIIEVNVCKIIK